MDTTLLKNQIRILREAFDALAKIAPGGFNGKRYIEDLCTLGVRIAHADGTISAKELQTINNFLGICLTPYCSEITTALSSTESNFVSAPPFCTAAAFMMESMVGTKMVQTNWEVLYCFGYAVAMSTGGRGSQEEKYLNNYFDTLLSKGMVMGVKTHPLSTITALSLKNIEDGVR